MCWVGGSRFRSFCYLEGCPMFLSRVEAPERVALHLPVVQEEFRALPTCNLVPPLHLCKRKVQGPGAYSKAVLCPALSHDLEREGRREARVHTCATHTHTYICTDTHAPTGTQLPAFPKARVRFPAEWSRPRYYAGAWGDENGSPAVSRPSGSRAVQEVQDRSSRIFSPTVKEGFGWGRQIGGPSPEDPL